MSYNITNGLCTIADVKGRMRLTDTIDDDQIALAIDSSSRLIEAECQRVFTKADAASARVFVAETYRLCEVDDISTTSGMIVKVDHTGTGNFDTTLQTSDYQLEPLNGLYQGETWPYTKIRAIRSQYFPVYGGIAYPSPYTQALVQVTAVWGWPAIPTPVREAAIIQSIATFKAADAPFGATPFAETGVIRLRTSLHPTAARLIKKYQENKVYVA